MWQCNSFSQDVSQCCFVRADRKSVSAADLSACCIRIWSEAKLLTMPRIKQHMRPMPPVSWRNSLLSSTLNMQGSKDVMHSRMCMDGSSTPWIWFSFLRRSDDTIITPNRSLQWKKGVEFKLSGKCVPWQPSFEFKTTCCRGTLSPLS